MASAKRPGSLAVRRIGEFLECTVVCGRSGKQICIPAINGFKEKDQLVDCLMHMGWRKIRTYGWVRPYYAQQEAYKKRRRKKGRKWIARAFSAL